MKKKKNEDKFIVQSLRQLELETDCPPITDMLRSSIKTKIKHAQKQNKDTKMHNPTSSQG